MSAANHFRTFASRILPSSFLSTALIFATAPPAFAATKIVTPKLTFKLEPAKENPLPTVESLRSLAATGPFRILLVDDDVSDNNNIPGDTRRSISDKVFNKLVSDAVGGKAGSWAIETVKTNANGPGIDRLRPYSLIIWYTGSSYGGNPDNTCVLSIEDVKAARRARTAIAKGIEFLRTFPFSCRKASPEHPLLRELIISFGANGYVALFEIEDSQTVTVLAIRHQREEDFF